MPDGEAVQTERGQRGKREQASTYTYTGTKASNVRLMRLTKMGLAG